LRHKGRPPPSHSQSLRPRLLSPQQLSLKTAARELALNT
jgi:hypothetical protein